MQTVPPSTSPSRHERFARQWHHLLLALGGLCVLLLLGSSQWQASASLRALDELRQQAVRVEHLDSLLIQLMDAESAVRGYLLSGNRAHLEPYEQSLATVDTIVEDIRQELKSPENDDALADLAGMVAIKLRSLQQAVEQGRAGEAELSQGKRYTDRIRGRVLGLKTRLAAVGDDSFEHSTGHVARTRWVVATLAFGALALLVFLFFVLKRQFTLREQLASLLQSENQQLDALVRERTDELSDLASYLTNAREAEKARLARELHDELGALLTAAKMETGWIARKLDDSELTPCRERLARLEQLLDSGIALKRRIIDDLRPPLLEMLGLVSTLRALGEDFVKGNGEALSLDLPAEDIELAPEPALAIFRIAQEALTNIRRHAGARQIRLALRADAAWLHLEIADDGKGFRSAWVRGQHHGLAGMKHRVQMYAGEFTLDSTPGAGTRVAARFPRTAVAPRRSPAGQDGSACLT
jgi:signal transduction histidine kinase